MAKVFISYRRDDSSGYAGRLFDRLTRHFGPDSVFMDVDTIGAGADFVQVLEEAVSSCQVLLALIGRRWLDARDADGKRRLDDPNDFVRREVATALAGDGATIPVLVDGSSMPPREALPDELAPLSRRNAVELSNTRWDYDVDKLVAAIEAAGVERARPSPWRRLLVPGLAAAAVVATLAVGYLALRSRPGTTDATGPDQPAAVEEIVIRPSVAVFGLRNSSGREDDEWLSTATAEMLTTELGAGDQIRTVSGNRVSEALRELGLEGVKDLTAEQLKGLRQNLGADAVVAGSYTLLGDGDTALVRLDLRLYDAVTGETMTPVEATGTKQQLFDLIDRASKSLRERLGAAELTPGQAVEVKAAYPAGVEVMRLYFRAVESLRRFDAKSAVDLLDKAVAMDPEHPLPRRALSEALFYLGNTVEAGKAARTASELAGALPERERLAIEARVAVCDGNFVKAADTYRSLADSFPDEIEYGLRLAESRIEEGKPLEALAALERLHRLPPPLSENPQIALAEAHAYLLLGDSDQALSAASRAAQEAEQWGSDPLRAAARMRQARAHWAQGNSEQATALAEEARALYEGVEDLRGVAEALELMALGVRLQGDLDGASRLLQRALASYQGMGDRSGEARVLGSIGAVLLSQGKLNEAEQSHRQALEILEELGDTNRVAFALNEFGYNLHMRGELRAALSRYQEALNIVSGLGRRRELGIALTNVAEIQFLLGNLDEAESMHEEVLAIDRETGDRSSVAYDTVQLGLIHAARGDLFVARSKLEGALETQTELGEAVSAAETRMYLAEVALAEGKAAEAEELGRQAEQVLRAEGAADLALLAQTVLADALVAQGKVAEASRLSARASEAAGGSMDRRVQYATAILEARVQALSDAKNVDGAVAALDRVAEDAAEAELVAYGLEARLIAAEIEHAAGRPSGKAHLEEVQRDAEAWGLGQIASRAAAVLGS